MLIYIIALEFRI